jgi:hypothetical protein
MNRRLVLNLSLAGAIIVLALVVILEPGKKTPELPKITALTPEQITRVQIERSGRDTVVLEKQGEQWRITQPLNLRANEFRVSTVLRVAQTGSHAHFDAAGRDLKQFELDAPKVRLHLGEQLIEFGGVNPLDNRRYLRVGDVIHLTGDDSYFRLITDAASFVSTALLPERAQELSEIRLPDLSVKRGADGKWTVTPPVADLSADDVNKFVDEWRHAQALQVVAYTGTPTGGTATLVIGDGATQFQFDIMADDGDLVLGRKDAGVQYQFTADARKRMLTLKLPATAASGSETAGPASK